MSTWKPAYHKDQRNMRTPTPLADIHQLKTILHEFRFAVLVSYNTKSRRINLFLSEGKPGIMVPREVKYPRIFFFKCLLAHHNGTHTSDLNYQEPDTRQSFESRSLKQVRVS